jgi:pre-peptidase
MSPHWSVSSSSGGNYMGENGSSGKIIVGIVVVVIVMVLVIGGVVAALLLMSSSGDDKTDKESAEGVVGDFIEAFKEEDTDTIGDLIMDPDGNFYKDTHPDDMDELLEFFTDTEMEMTEWNIDKVEETSWKANNTGPIFLITITAKNKDMDSGDIHSETDVLMVAKNSESGDWGVSLDGFDFDLEADEFELDNDTGTATVISPGKSDKHSIHIDEDEDWFTFTLSANETVKVWVYGQYGGDTEMSLYTQEDAPDTYLEFNDDRDEDMFSEIEAELQAGTYFVKVIGYDNDETIIEYTLEMEFIS